MKRNLGIIVVAFLLVFILSGCESAGAGADSNGSGNGSFTYDGASYSLEKLITEYYGENTGAGESGYNIAAYLVSSGISYDSVSDEITGTGDFVYLDLNTATASSLSADSYSWSSSNSVGTIIGATSGTSYDYDAGTGQNVSGSSGTVTIRGDSSEWTIEFDLTMSDGKSVTGSYTGDVDTSY